MMMMRKQQRRSGERGQSVVEVTLMAPWIFFLFLGIVDFGFYGYALVATENAARVAALFTSQSKDSASDDAGACIHATNELRMVPNFGSFVAGCQGGPLRVDAAEVAAADSADGELATQVSVTYDTIPMFPIPGLTGQLTITRIVEMRVEDDQ